MRRPNKADFLTGMWLVLVAIIIFTCKPVEAHKKADFETIVKCIDGYKFAIVLNSEKDSKYVKILDAEQIFNTKGEAIMCGLGHEDNIFPDVESSSSVSH